MYDFDAACLGRKVRSFINEYEESRARHGGKIVEGSDLGTTIKWTRDLKRQLLLDIPNTFDRDSISTTVFRPFVTKKLYFNQNLNEMQYQIPQVFPPTTSGQNKVICFSGVASTKPFSVLATDKVFGHDTLEKTQCLPLYRYTGDGERVSNITQWGIDRINGHYRQEWGDDFQELAGANGITAAKEIFAYTYAVLHDPAYRHEYAVDLLREFPRLPLYQEFHQWAEMGKKLLDLHIGFESAEPYPLERQDRKDVNPKRAILRADKEQGIITLDERTTLTGIPDQAWEYRLGSRSALEWVLDQYKERKPRDPTIREKFNTYRFSNHKESVIELLRRVCTISVATMEIVDGMASHEGEA